MRFLDNFNGLNGNCLSKIVKCFCCNYPGEIPLGNNHCVNKCSFPFLIDALQIENFLTNLTCGCTKTKCCDTGNSCNSCNTCNACNTCYKLPNSNCNKLNNCNNNSYIPRENIMKTVSNDIIGLFNKTTR